MMRDMKNPDAGGRRGLRGRVVMAGDAPEDNPDPLDLQAARIGRMVHVSEPLARAIARAAFGEGLA
ncbi:MAG: hypothetical protein ACQEUZ_07425 [Pseudomonadota bacterium]